MKTLCVVAESVNRIQVAEYDVRDPLPDEILVETRYSAVSPGTELRCLAGREANAGAFPMITGYSLVGRVLRGAGNIRENDVVFLPGARVMPRGITRAWGGHVGLAIAPATLALKLEPNTDFVQASALAMLSIAMHGVLKAAPSVGDRVLVVGLGLIGQLAAALFRLAGCRVAVCDPVEQRRTLAAPDGRCSYAPNPGWQEAAGADFPEGFDIVTDVTGVPAVVSANLPLLREKSWEDPGDPSPKLVLLASYPGNIALDHQDTLFNKETEVVTCRDYLPRDLRRAARLLASRAIDLAPLLTVVMPVTSAADAYRRLREEPQHALTAVFDWRNPLCKTPERKVTRT